MNTYTIQTRFETLLAKTKPAAPIADGGPCAGIQIFRTMIEVASSDEQVETWLAEAIAGFVDFERKLVDAYLGSCPGVRRGDVRIVRRSPPKVDRIRDEKCQLLHWVASARSGVRVSDWAADPHSSASVARENARREQAAKQEREAEREGAWD